jgi:hypothetical protein
MLEPVQYWTKLTQLGIFIYLFFLVHSRTERVNADASVGFLDPDAQLCYNG